MQGFISLQIDDLQRAFELLQQQVPQSYSEVLCAGHSRSADHVEHRARGTTAQLRVKLLREDGCIALTLHNLGLLGFRRNHCL